MKLFKAMLFLTISLLVINVVDAYTLNSYDSQYNIVGNKIVVQTIITASEAIILSLPIPADAEIVEVYLNDIKFNAAIEDNSLKMNLNKNDQLKLEYITSGFIDNSNFLLNLPIGYGVGLLKITLVLPEEAVLKKPITDTTGSIYPKPDKAETDGRSLIFTWERTNVQAGDEVAIFAMYKTKNNYIPIITVAAAFILLVYILYIKKPKKIKKIKTKKPKKESEILEHLKEEEQQIVRVLKQREGQCEQGTLRVVTGFSKAHLSRLLMELEARKIIYKEKRGKKNLIFLK